MPWPTACVVFTPQKMIGGRWYSTTPCPIFATRTGDNKMLDLRPTAIGTDGYIIGRHGAPGMAAEFKNWPANNIWTGHIARLADVHLIDSHLGLTIAGEHEIYATFPFDSHHHLRLRSLILWHCITEPPVPKGRVLSCVNG